MSIALFSPHFPEKPQPFFSSSFRNIPILLWNTFIIPVFGCINKELGWNAEYYSLLVFLLLTGKPLFLMAEEKGCFFFSCIDIRLYYFLIPLTPKDSELFFHEKFFSGFCV